MQCATRLDSLLALSPLPKSNSNSESNSSSNTRNDDSNSNSSSAILVSVDDDADYAGNTGNDSTGPSRSASSHHRSSRRSSSSTAGSLESLDFKTSGSTSTTSSSTKTNTTATMTTTIAGEMRNAAAASGKENAENAANANANASASGGKTSNAPKTTSTGTGTCAGTGGKSTTDAHVGKLQKKECAACHELKGRDEYSASQWKNKKKGGSKNSAGSGSGGGSGSSAGGGRRCMQCISVAQAHAHAQTKAVVAAAVAIGTVGAVCSAAGATSSNKGKKNGLADRGTNSNNTCTAEDENEGENDQKGSTDTAGNMAEMHDNDTTEAQEMMEAEVVDDDEEDGDDDEEDDDEEDDDDALTLTNFDHTNASLLTVEQSPAKQGTNVLVGIGNSTSNADGNGNDNADGNSNGNGNADGNANADGSSANVAIEPIGVIHEVVEEEAGVQGPTPRAADGQVFAGFSPVLTACAAAGSTSRTTSTSTNMVIAIADTTKENDEEIDARSSYDDEALMSTYSFSLYEAEVSLEHIRSLQSTSSNDPANTLTVATDALALPCFKASVLRDLTASKQSTAGETSPPPLCSPTVNSMASMFATHAAFMASPFSGTNAGTGADRNGSSGFASPAVASTSTSPGAGSPLRLTGIDTRHLSDVYSQLQIAAAQSELALDRADSALARIESIFRDVVVASDAADESAVIQLPSTSGILELGLVLSDAYWVVGDASKADAVRQILNEHVKQPTSSDEADMAATGSFEDTCGMTATVQDIAVGLLNVMEPEESEKELGPITEVEEDEAEDADEAIVLLPTSTKHVHFDTSASSAGIDEASPRSPVADELNDISGRKIATSILKGGGYPTSTTKQAEEVQAKDPTNEVVEDKPSRPDVAQHLYHTYRSTFEFGKEHIPVGGQLLGLAESTASTSIKIASLGHLDLQAIDEKLIGPHIVKGLDDIIVNPVFETVGGVVNGIGGAVGAVISVLPFVGGGGRDEEEKEE